MIIAIGGYAASNDLVYKYSNGTITTKLTSCAATSTGDGLALAENVGGIQIDTDAHVLNADGNAISGLYAAGEVTSGIHGNNRLGGNAYPDIITFGRITGTNAAADAKA